MKILFLFTVNRSFLSDYFVALAANVSKRGYETVIFSFKKKESREHKDGVTYISDKKKGVLNEYRTIYSIIKAEAPDIIVSNFSYVNPALLAGKFLKGTKSIAWQHTLIAQTKAKKRQIFVKSCFLRLADTIIVNSNYLKSELENKFGLKQKKIVLLPFWSSIDCYEPKKIILPKADYLVGCCGRLEIDKNQRTLLRAFAQLKKRLPDKKLKLVLAGEGTDASYLKQMTKDLEIEHSVLFLGLLSAEEMVFFYNNVDILVLPSLHEAFGLTFIEALALNRPVLVSQAFGALTFIAPSFLSAYNITFKPDNAESIANKLEQHISEEPHETNKYRVLYDTCYSTDTILRKFDNIIES